MPDFSNPTDGKIVSEGRKSWQYSAARQTWDLISTPAADPELLGNIAAQVAISEAEARLARDTSWGTARLYASTVAALADGGLAVGQYFAAISADNHEVAAIYLKAAGPVATDTGKRLPTADAVLKPTWSGKKNGWPDPFFRSINMESVTQYGRTRWMASGGGSGLPSHTFTKVANAIFDGYALRRSGDLGSTFLNGPAVWLDDIGAVEGDTITVYALFVSDGATVSAPGRFYTSAGAAVGSQVNPVSDTGATTLPTLGATPKWLRHEHVVPATAARFWLYPYSTTAGKTFDLVAVWAVKGSAAASPVWPTLSDPNNLSYSVTDQGARLASAETSLAAHTPALNYAVSTHGVVTAEAASITLDGTGFGNLARDLAFMGWGERYTPSGVSFNAVKVKSIARSSAATAKWRTLGVIVRTGASSHSAGATLVAVGSTTVLEASDTLTDVTILLKDPTTGAVKTLTDVDFADGEYFVGVYAQTSVGAPAACGEPRGTMANSLGQSYYYSSGANTPKTGAWIATSAPSNARLGFQHLQLTSPAEGVAHQPGAQLAADLAVQATPPAPELVLPPYAFGVQGREANIYTDNLLLADAAEYNWDFASTQGAQQDERWTWTPTGALGAGTLSVTAHDKRAGTALATKTTQIRAAASNAGSGLTKKVLVIGDSLTNAGTITQTLLDIAGTDVMGVTLLGTRGTAPNLHEGRGGWSINDYTTAGRTYFQFTVSGVVTAPAINSTTYTNNGNTYTVQELSLVGGAGTITCSVSPLGAAPTASGTLTKASGSGDATIAFSASASVPGNPFWIGGALNFAQYLTNNAIALPNWVFVALGINDCFSETDDAACSALADAELLKLDALIASIKAADANVKLGLIIPSPPSAHQDAFGANYASGQTRWRFKRNILIWARQLIAKYAGQEASRIYLVPSNTALDTVNNMNTAASAPVNSRSAVSVSRQNNGVHPADAGYRQIADALWAFLKYYAGV